MNPPGSAEPYTPCLATSWEVSDDGMTWTFNLREGVTFHDGTPFTSEDVKDSIESTLELDLGAAYMWYPVEKITTPDDYTVKIKTSYPAALDRVATAMYGAWMFSAEAAGKDTKWWDTPNEAGTGPWMLESYAPNEETVFVRNPDYWGGWQEGQFQKVVIKYVDESATQRQMLEAGEVDFADGLALDSIPSLKENPDVKIVEIPSIQNYLMQFNTQRKPLDDVRVRQALSYALPYEDIIELGTNGYAVQSRGPTPENLYPHDPELFQYTYDVEQGEAAARRGRLSGRRLQAEAHLRLGRAVRAEVRAAGQGGVRRDRRRGRPAAAAVRAAVGDGEGPGRPDARTCSRSSGGRGSPTATTASTRSSTPRRTRCGTCPTGTTRRTTT